MTQAKITSVTSDNVVDLDFALRALSSEMGDKHVAGLGTLKAAFLGTHSAFNALLAYLSNEVAGAIVWSPQFSTTRGGGGLYVSDLWTAPSARGQGVGRKLLAHALFDAENSTGARFLKLSVHRTNPAAFSYYSNIGFLEEAEMLGMTLEGAALQRIKEL